VDTTLLIVIVALVGGMLLTGVWAFSCRSREHSLRGQLADLERELARQVAAIDEAKREIARLQRIPKTEILPMLQLAHELRSPLASVVNALDMLLQGYAVPGSEMRDEMLNLARGRAEAMLLRVNDFLRLGAVRHAEIERKAEAVQLAEVLHRLEPEMRVRARWRAVELNIQAPEVLPLVRATSEDMEHLLSNLINNAIKYTNPGGRVKVSLQAREGAVVGTVADTGIGIGAKDLPRIFDEFYRADGAKDMDAQGSGLGLSIVKRIVDLYSGQITVRSELGKGSEFTFTFPRIHPAE